MRHPWRLAAAASVMMLLGVGAYVAWAGYRAVGELTGTRDSLSQATSAISAGNFDRASTALAEAATSSQAAAGAVSGPAWSLAAALPVVGDTPAALRAVAVAAAQSLGQVQEIAPLMARFQPSALVESGGRVNVDTLIAAQRPLARALVGLDSAAETLEAAPVGERRGVIPGQLDAAAVQLWDELDTVRATIRAWSPVVAALPALLGGDEPRDYLVVVTNPNEARGQGGFVGVNGILHLDNGSFTVTDLAPNSRLARLEELPPTTEASFLRRYQDDLDMIANYNISPNFPDGAKLWQAAYYTATGRETDGVISVDVEALGALVRSTGRLVRAPDGTSLDGPALTRFLLRGVYDKFPLARQSRDRDAYDIALGTAALEHILGFTRPAQLIDTVLAQMERAGIQIYSARADEEQLIATTRAAGSLAAADGPNVYLALINASASKLDAYLERSLDYRVGRCPDPDSMVRSTVTVKVSSNLPVGVSLPAYVVGQAAQGPTGPVNSTMVQLHLSNGSRVKAVLVDGRLAAYSPFTEAQRPSLVVRLDLPPRVVRTVEVQFVEPALATAPVVLEQPLATPLTVTTEDVPCS